MTCAVDEDNGRSETARTTPSSIRISTFSTNSPLRGSSKLPALNKNDMSLPFIKIKKNFLRSEEHTSELQSLMRISYAVFCLNKTINTQQLDILHARIL